jgi:hypothetical protein
LNAHTSGDVILVFAEISHPDLAVPIRVVSDTASYVWNGNTWLGVMFDFQILTDNEGMPESRVIVPNIDASLGMSLVGLNKPPSVKFWILSSADFNLAVNPRTALAVPDVEYYAEGLFLADVVVDAMQVSARLVSYDYSTEYAFRQRATKDRAPGCWR